MKKRVLKTTSLLLVGIMFISCGSSLSSAKRGGKHTGNLSNQEKFNDYKNLGEGEVATSTDGNTVYYTSDNVAYKMVLEEKNKKTTVSIYNEDNDLLQSAETKDKSNTIISYNYAAENKKARSGPEIVTYDLDNGSDITVEDVKLSKEEQEQALEDYLSVSETEDSISNKARATSTSTRYGNKYLKTEPILDTGLTPNHSIYGSWYYLGGTTYNGIDGYLSRTRKPSGSMSSAKKVKLQAHVTLSSAALTVVQYVKQGLTLANVYYFLAGYVIDNVIAYACAETVSYRPFHFTYKVQCNWDAKVWYTFCKESEIWFSKTERTDVANKYYTRYEWKKQKHGYKDNLISNVQDGILQKQNGKVLDVSCGK